MRGWFPKEGVLPFLCVVSRKGVSKGKGKSKFLSPLRTFGHFPSVRKVPLSSPRKEKRKPQTVIAQQEEQAHPLRKFYPHPPRPAQGKRIPTATSLPRNDEDFLHIQMSRHCEAHRAVAIRMPLPSYQKNGSPRFARDDGKRKRTM